MGRYSVERQIEERKRTSVSVDYPSKNLAGRAAESLVAFTAQCAIRVKNP
jgi:hypothetical protein